ncbi:MAG TPA: GNAT family N-acetyltransferase [Acidimicrobiales bacterium]|nr:GNAT family N-acetyltransferase [Acidimicrobiales bacterium]
MSGGSRPGGSRSGGSGPGGSALIELADRYLDSAPRADADALDLGPWTLFVSRTIWAYYARPRRGLDRPVAASDVAQVVEACTVRGLDPAIQWLAELHPELDGAATEEGLTVARHALMAAPAADVADTASVVGPGSVAGAGSGAEARVTVLDAGDPRLVPARAVAFVAFMAGGTARGPEGSAARDRLQSRLDPADVGYMKDRAARGLTVTAVAETGDGVVAAGSYQPVGDVAEIVAVGTLPAARRRGLAAAVTAGLAAHAADHGVRTLLLSAESDEVVRVYRRVGFVRIGTAASAEPDDGG